ncbi:4a-hydroxytetrahydrobiopterin dehydratase [Nocardioides guangzhouensis]|uniref:Putative pterin-4-alpha-carbinolamine dehydratase n=1 Tax=Nocardioides guangzhouensis TaxID=2497878 RepID=A0A4Q4YY93_9ACTN|nr:4a-hydroxytetrahydrobiopterin dehydratase [Nocardioides guangzhouensis]RYP80143.1 4a-hydroxytetrahydrobiopterin dehydratase [Nocardioides guangzhouensis]
MTDKQERLTSTQVRDANLADWRQILGRLKARFRTGDFATGLALVDKIGEVAEDSDHHPGILFTYSDVIVTLVSHDVRGITSRDLDLARRISSLAAELEIESDVSGITQLELGLDTSLGEGLAPFYAALLGGAVDSGEPDDPSGQVPTVWWQEPDGTDETYALPEQSFEQRWHFDVWVPHDEGERRLQAVLDAGGRLVSDRAAPAYWVVEDADGNRSCICTPAGR